VTIASLVLTFYVLLILGCGERKIFWNIISPFVFKQIFLLSASEVHKLSAETSSSTLYLTLPAAAGEACKLQLI
jgi:hypothetical protein